MRLPAPRPGEDHGGALARKLGDALPGLLVAGLAWLALLPVASALAAGPTITITSPASGSATNDQTPTFSGTASYAENKEGVGVRVTVKIKPQGGGDGTAATDEGTWETQTPTWSVPTTEALPPATYTAEVELKEVGGSEPLTTIETVSFTVDITPPSLTLTSPADGSSTTSSSQVVGGAAGVAPGDQPYVTAELFTGTTIGSQAPVEALTVPASEGAWTATFGGLGTGTYSVRAEQRDEAGNVGFSAVRSFTVNSPSSSSSGGGGGSGGTSSSAPLASFRWFPVTPSVGQPVSLISSSTDAASPIVAFAWSLSAIGPLQAGSSTLTTSFNTPGAHVVRLRVSAADGQSSIATETIQVVRSTPALMDPFPIVRLAGRVTADGVRLSLVSVLAPVGARVQVACHGRGCPRSPASRLASVGRGPHHPSMLVLAFPRFERALRAGAILEIRVSESGRVGKYTRFLIRRGTIPQRLDSCLGPAGARPIACPSA